MKQFPLNTLVESAKRGDTHAFDGLVRQYQGVAIGYAYSQLSDLDAAEDAAQDAFVQAWLDLNSLSQPSAFSGWLRRIVFKYCDRGRRSARPTLPILDNVIAPAEMEPQAVLERNVEAGRIRGAVLELPAAQREATVLYYFSGSRVNEIARFLDLPPSTVKNRLYAARKRLRKELSDMNDPLQTAIESRDRSHDDRFAQKVLERILHEFQSQEATDPHTADRGLLDAGRDALIAIAASNDELVEGDVRAGFMLLWRNRRWSDLSSLLMRYLGQHLTASQSAWSRLHLANVLACGGSPAGAVLAHEAFLRDIADRAPCLARPWPFYPLTDGPTEDAYAGDDVGLLFLSQSWEFASSYTAVWRTDNYLAQVDSALAKTNPTANNRDLRFYVRRMAVTACEAAAQFDRAQKYIDGMYALITEVDPLSERDSLQARANGHDMNLANLRSDEPRFISLANQALALLSKYNDTDGLPTWVPEQRHDLACKLIGKGQHDLALPLLEANHRCGGQIGGWGWLMHSAAVWHVSKDRDRTIALLREARAHDDRDMAALFAERNEFADVWSDPDFLGAVSRR